MSCILEAGRELSMTLFSTFRSARCTAWKNHKTTLYAAAAISQEEAQCLLLLSPDTHYPHRPNLG